MKRIHLMCGLPYSGKTTLAGHLAARLGAELVSLDEISAARGLDGASELPVEEWAQSHEIALERTRDLMATGHPIVVDDTHGYRWQRDDYRRIATEGGYTVEVVLLETPFDVLLERQRRTAEAGQRGASVDLLVRMAQEFQAPTPDEHALHYLDDEPLEAWLAAHALQES